MAAGTMMSTAPAAKLLRVLKRVGALYGRFALLHVSVKIAQFLLMKRRFDRMVSGLPGQRPDWTGSGLMENWTLFQDYCLKMLEPHRGKPLVTWSMPGPEVVCLTPESVEWMLKTEFQHFTKPGDEDELFVMLKMFIGDSIFTLRHGEANPDEHARWYKQRKAASLIFTKSQFSHFMQETFVAKGRNMIAMLEELAKHNDGVEHDDARRGARKVDMQKLFFSFTFDSIQQIFFGHEVDTVSKAEVDPYACAFDGAHRAMMRFLFRKTPALLLTNMLPWPLGPITAERLSTGLALHAIRHTDADFADFQRHVADLHRITREKVAALRADPDLIERQDLISNFLKPSKTMDIKWTDDELQAIVLNFIIAGRDTTACALSWLFYELSVNQDVQRKLQDEIDTVLAGREPTYEDVKADRMPYLNGVLMEALRLHPPVPQDIKVANADVEYPDGTKIDKGTRCYFVPYVMGRDPERYPEPLRFNPDRWIPFRPPTEFEFPVFQGAKRACLGMDMAKFEAKLLTAMLVQKLRFNFEANEQEDIIRPSLAVTMSLCNSADQSTHELWLVPRSRT